MQKFKIELIILSFIVLVLALIPLAFIILK